MILDLTIAAAREQAKAAAHAQGDLPVLVRTGDDFAATRWPAADVLAYLDRAELLERHGSVVTTHLRGDYVRRFYLPQFPAPLLDEDRGDGDGDGDDDDGDGTAAAAGTGSTASQDAAEDAWEVDDAAGHVLYLGLDVELAHELTASIPGAHLRPRYARPSVAPAWAVTA